MIKKTGNFNDWLGRQLAKLPDKPLAVAYDRYTDTVKSPLVTAALLSGGTYLLGRAAWNPIVETVRSLGRPFAPMVERMDLGSDEKKSYDETIDELKNDSSYRKFIPAAIAAIAGALPLYTAYNYKEGLGSLLKYNKGMKKEGAFGLDDSMSYLQQVDWQEPVNLTTATSMFINDPHFDKDPYAKHMGTAIVNNAAIANNTMKPTLGNIFDSAADKIEKKLNLGGLSHVGIRTTIANSAARLFTGALGSVCDLNPKARQSLIDAGTWAGAITSILD